MQCIGHPRSSSSGRAKNRSGAPAVRRLAVQRPGVRVPDFDEQRGCGRRFCPGAERSPYARAHHLQAKGPACTITQRHTTRSSSRSAISRSPPTGSSSSAGCTEAARHRWRTSWPSTSRSPGCVATTVKMDEGQHLQDVYPRTRLRDGQVRAGTGSPPHEDSQLGLARERAAAADRLGALLGPEQPPAVWRRLRAT